MCLDQCEASGQYQGSYYSLCYRDGKIHFHVHSFKFCIKFSFTANDVAQENVGNSSECCFDGKLQVKFAVGITQVCNIIKS